MDYPFFALPSSALPWIMIGVAIVLSLITVGILLHPLRRVASLPSAVSDRYEPDAETGTMEIQATEDYTESTTTPGQDPVVSIVVHSLSPDEELDQYLESLGRQEFRQFETIVVCEATAESTKILAERCALRYPGTYVTFIPPGSHNLSRRKLALTLGMKAAKGRIVVTTVANAVIPSTRWLSELVKPFLAPGGESVDLSLGYTHIDFSEMRGAGKWYREFNAMLTDAQWIGYALNGEPYRGDGFNLAFRRHLFFEHKGYSKSNYVHSGDDDLFVSEIATGDNTSVVVNPDTILTTQWGPSANRMWRLRKEQYAFTSRWLRRRPFLEAGAASLMQWLVAGSLTAAGILGLPGLIAAFCALVTLLLFWLAEISLYRKAAPKLQATRLWWALPWFWLAKPVLNFIFKIRNIRQRKKNFTWQR